MHADRVRRGRTGRGGRRAVHVRWACLGYPDVSMGASCGGPWGRGCVCSCCRRAANAMFCSTVASDVDGGADGAASCSRRAFAFASGGADGAAGEEGSSSMSASLSERLLEEDCASAMT